MKAAVYTRYGPPDVLQIKDVEKPIPADNEVLIVVRAAALNALDWRLMRGKPWILRPMMGGLRKPRVTTPGLDVAGRVEAVGRNVTRLKPGDEVFGACRRAIAEYACAIEGKLAIKPANLSFEEAAAVPVAALTALQGLRDRGRIQQGQKVLVDGASGGVGTYTIQIARSFGAEVTAVCSTQNVDVARSLGAAHVIDYTREDFRHSRQRYDLILAANAHRSIFDYWRALSPNGIYVMAGGGWVQILQAMMLGPLLSLIGGRKFRFFMARVDESDLGLLKDLLAAGTIVSVIDRRYPLDDAAEAIRYLAEGHARGKVVINF
jgi:NADPH:quinone reductase-like Zn-dependent oxidoreductase